MPIPKPETGESQDDFVSRCMSNDTMKEDYPENDQRLAICYSSWRKKHGGEEPGNQDKPKGYSIKAQAMEAEVWLYDEIGSGWFGGLSAKQFADDINKLGKIQNITIRLNSPGGDVFDGLAIYNILKSHPARVIVNIDGIAASIASVIAMAGDEINIAENAFLMIHEPWTMAMGNATEMRETADRLEKVSGSILGTYAKRTKISEAKLAEMMAKETWMTGTEALEMGFADTLTETMQMAACFDLNKYKFRHNPFAAKAEEADITKLPEADAPGAGEPMLPEPEIPKKLNLEIFERGIECCQKILERGQKK